MKKNITTTNFSSITKSQFQNELLEFLWYGESISIKPTEVLMEVESPYSEWTTIQEFIPQMCLCTEICRDSISGKLYVRAGRSHTAFISELSDTDITKLYNNFH